MPPLSRLNLNDDCVNDPATGEGWGITVLSDEIEARRRRKCLRFLSSNQGLDRAAILRRRRHSRNGHDRWPIPSPSRWASQPVRRAKKVQTPPAVVISLRTVSVFSRAKFKQPPRAGSSGAARRGARDHALELSFWRSRRPPRTRGRQRQPLEAPGMSAVALASRNLASRRRTTGTFQTLIGSDQVQR